MGATEARLKAGEWKDRGPHGFHHRAAIARHGSKWSTARGAEPRSARRPPIRLVLITTCSHAEHPRRHCCDAPHWRRRRVASADPLPHPSGGLSGARQSGTKISIRYRLVDSHDRSARTAPFAGAGRLHHRHPAMVREPPRKRSIAVSTWGRRIGRFATAPAKGCSCPAVGILGYTHAWPGGSQINAIDLRKAPPGRPDVSSTGSRCSSLLENPVCFHCRAEARYARHLHGSRVTALALREVWT